MPATPPPRPEKVSPQSLDALAALLGGRVHGDGVITVTGVTNAAQEVRPGDLYVARAGARVHGVDFVDEAARRGAAAVLTDEAAAARVTGLPVVTVGDPRGALGRVAAAVYGDPAAALMVFGVTGTNGKTTTTYLIDAGLRAAGHRTGLIGTVETRLGDTVLPSVRTTPEAGDLHALFGVMREAGADAVSMEVSSHALALDRVVGVRFTVAVFTNLSQDHLDFHPTLEDYFAAKAMLFTPDYTQRAVVNVDDAHGARLADMAQVPTVRVSPSGQATADWWTEDVEVTRDGTTFVLRGPDGVRQQCRLLLPGGFNVDNAALALVALAEADVPLAVAAEGMAALTGVAGRMERVDAGQPFLAVVDYAHTPEAVVRVLREARALTHGNVIVVLGCGGDRDRTKRPLMGHAVSELADVAVLTNDNPRSEDPAAILEQMRAGVVPGSEVVVEPDRHKAIAIAVGRAQPGDVVVVAGKGHEQGQEFADRTLPFDDRAVLRECLAALGSVA